MKTVFASVYHL
jgi:hypothetical protein